MNAIKFVRQYLTSTLSYVIILCMFSTTSCKKLIDVDPPINQVIGNEIYNSNITAASVLTGIYTTMSNGSSFSGYASVSLKTGLSADELVSTTDPTDLLSLLYRNSLTREGGALFFWRDMYSYIYKANSAIEGISASENLSEPVKKQLLGEAKFVRALMYFYLINLYGDVPLLTTTDIVVNTTAGRTSVDQVYQQIESDLIEAKNGLSDMYLAANITTPAVERVRPNKWAAAALLSRVFLYTGQWAKAADEATAIINNDAQYQLETLQRTFLVDSKEAIWQLQSVAVEMNTLDASMFVLKEGNGKIAGPDADPNGRPVYVSQNLWTAFEPGDRRKIEWLDSVTIGGMTYPFPNKYKIWLPNEPKTESLMMLRLSEQYLIRAESRARLGLLLGTNSASSDLNLIRQKAGLPEIYPDTEQRAIAAIHHERQVELFTELGHRWLDLKRSGTINQIMPGISQQKGGTWDPYKAKYPLPIEDLTRNPNLRNMQNPGYPEM